MLITILPRIILRNRRMLALSFGSLLVGALALATVLGLIGSVHQFFVAQSQELIGGDIAIERAQEIDLTQSPPLATLARDNAVFSRHIETYIVVQSNQHKEGVVPMSLLASLKVVDDAYPLFGKLTLTGSDTFELNDDEVAVAPELLLRLGLSVGDTLTIGKSAYRINDTILSEPDRVGGSFRLGPVVIVSAHGWGRAGIDSARSRTSHTLSIKYPVLYTNEQRVAVERDIESFFKNSGARLSFASRGPSSLLRVLDSAERFFFTMIVLALFLVVVNIRINLVYFLASFQKTIAIMKSVGMRQHSIISLFLALLSVLAVSASILGTLLGNVVARAVLPYAEKIVGSTLPTPEIFTSLSLVILFTLFLSIFSSLSFLVRIARITPKLLLLGYGGVREQKYGLLHEVPELLLTLIGLFAGIWYLTERVLVAGIAVGGIFVIFALLMLCTQFIINTLHRVRFRLSPSARYIANFLKQGGMIGVTVVASVTIALASVFAITLLEQNVLGNLRVDFRKDAPNLYVLDIQEDQREGVRASMNKSWKDFSTIRGRFISRDGTLIQERLNQEDPELGREFNLTYRDTLIEGERVIAGTWHGANGNHEVSVEKDFAERAKISLGSRLVFLVQGISIEATVTSIREVTTTNGLPFFFLVYSPDVLSQIPKSYFGYAYIPEVDIPLLQNLLATTYPNISSIPTTQILETVAKVVSALSTAVVVTALPALLLGLILIIAMLVLSAGARANDMLVFTTFGATAKMLFRLFITESLVMICCAGIFAIFIAHVGVWALDYYLFQFKGFYFSIVNAYVFLGVLAATFIISAFIARRFVAQTPVELLRKNL